jgi:hypothetical protein
MKTEELEKEFERLKLENPILRAALMLHRRGDCSLENALKYAVVYLAKESAVYKNSVFRALTTSRVPLDFADGLSLSVDAPLSDESACFLESLLPRLPLYCPKCKHQSLNDTWRRSGDGWHCSHCGHLLDEAEADRCH